MRRTNLKDGIIIINYNLTLRFEFYKVFIQRIYKIFFILTYSFIMQCFYLKNKIQKNILLERNVTQGCITPKQL